MNLRVIRSQTREFDNAPTKHFSVSHCSVKVDSAQTRIRKQEWGYICPMGHIPPVKRLQGSCEDIYFLHALSPFFNHTFYTERLSLPLPPSRGIKRMTQLYKAHTDVSCTALCNNKLNIVFQRPVALMYEYHFTYFHL
jgi:hypothetical protein